MPAPSRASRGQDAVLAGVEFVGRLEQLWLAHEAAGKDLVATVGQFHTDTAVHTMTKIPGRVWFSMDIRSEDNDVLLAIDRELRTIAAEIGARRGVTIDLGAYTNALPGPIDKGHRARLERLAAELGIPALPMGERRRPRLGGVRHARRPDGDDLRAQRPRQPQPDEAMDLADFAQAPAAGRRGGRDRCRVAFSAGSAATNKNDGVRMSAPTLFVPERSEGPSTAASTVPAVRIGAN
jgi:N-carbamoyl-L-amino-acid hydrolase